MPLEQGDKVVAAFTSAIFWVVVWSIAVAVWKWWVERE